MNSFLPAKAPLPPRLRMILWAAGGEGFDGQCVLLQLPQQD